jgi:hypothetical protein
MTALTVYSTTRTLGQITLDGGQLTGTTPGLQEIAASALRDHGGDAGAAYAGLNGFTNGYITIVGPPERTDR